MTSFANHTPLAAILLPHRDHRDCAQLLVIAKGCWRIDNGRFARGEQQAPLRQTPELLRLGALELEAPQRLALADRLDEQVVWLDHDLSPPKAAFDVMVAGHVTAPAGNPHAHIDAAIRVGDHIASLRAHPPRYWRLEWLDHRATPLGASVRRVPLCYAFADWHGGFPIDRPCWLPWIEAMDRPARPGRHARMPGGFGFWPESAAHRKPHAGTYDRAWDRERAPVLPVDFDTRFYNTAHPDAQLPHPPAAGAPIRLVHLAERPVIDCAFPSLELLAQASGADGRTRAPLALRPDTLILEPDQNRLSVVWRVLLPAAPSPTSGVRLFANANPI